MMNANAAITDDELAGYARLALDCVFREYPNHISHLLTSDADARPPRELTPVFYGCFDWHSAVHGHWLLARVARLTRRPALAQECVAAIAGNLTADNVLAEQRYLDPRPAFERPYGWAWLLALDAELTRLSGLEPSRWRGSLAPLVALIAGRVGSWLARLSHPVRSGVHSQTAFALGLVLDWARAVGDSALAALIEHHARGFYGADRDYPLHLEPSGEDFLSPSLGAADLLARVLAPAALGRWLSTVLPGIPARADAAWLPIVTSRDPADGRLAHLDGLCLSRAWMLERVADSLPADDARRPALVAAARAHLEAGLARVQSPHYAGAHWLGTFALLARTWRA